MNEVTSIIWCDKYYHDECKFKKWKKKNVLSFESTKKCWKVARWFHQLLRISRWFPSCKINLSSTNSNAKSKRNLQVNYNIPIHIAVHFLHNCNATFMNNCHSQKQTRLSVTKVTHEKHCRNKILCSKSCGHKISINFVDCLLPPGDFQLAGITGYFLATKPTTWYRKWFLHEYTMRKKKWKKVKRRRRFHEEDDDFP